MGVVTDFVIADVAEANSVLIEPSPTRRWPGVEAKSIDTIKLSTLHAIVTGLPLEVDSIVAYSEKFTFLVSTNDDERHVVLLPSEFVSALAKVKTERLPSVADAWLSTEEFQLDGWWTKAKVLEVVTLLHKLAVDAGRAKKPVLLLWGL
jgi:hypothetical protein